MLDRASTRVIITTTESLSLRMLFIFERLQFISAHPAGTRCQ